MKSLLVLSSLLFLFSCGKEQFGTAVKTESTNPLGVEKFDATFETGKTLLKPKVDIIYVVDNSGSITYIQESLRNSVRETLKTISTQFDFRVISTPLISTALGSGYNVYTNSTDPLPNSSYIVPTTDALITPIFNSIVDGNVTERGLGRTLDFMNYHKTSGLLRPNAYHLVILISNGHDQEVEEVWNQNYQTRLIKVNGTDETVFSQRLESFRQLKTALQSQQLRLFSVTASKSCATPSSGWKSSELSYQDMSRTLYQLSGAGDSLTNDIYDLCGNGLSRLFTGVNSSIQEVLVAHKYRYIPVTFADNNQTVDIDAIQVKKLSNGQVINLIKNTDWTYEYYPNGASKPTREDPADEYVTSKHFIRLNELLVHPDKISISSTSMVEYFQYVVLPRPAKNDGSIYIRVNGNNIPNSAITYEGYKANSNIKVLNGSNATPILRTGYFIKITNPTYYYKSGDNVEVNYTPDAI